MDQLGLEPVILMTQAQIDPLLLLGLTMGQGTNVHLLQGDLQQSKTECSIAQPAPLYRRMGIYVRLG